MSQLAAVKANSTPAPTPAPTNQTLEILGGVIDADHPLNS